MAHHRAQPGSRAARSRARAVERALGARLVLALAVLAAALGLEAAGRGFAADAQRGFYATIVAAFVLQIVWAAALDRVRALGRLAALQVAVDVALVSALVHFSGGADSVFAPLYVLVVVHAAMLLGRAGAYGAAAGGAVAFGLVMALERRGWLPLLDGPLVTPPVVEVAHWAVHAGALLLVALLASALTRELQRAGEDLDRSRSELSRVQRLHDRTVESLLSGLLTTDERGTVTSFNPEAEHITGLLAGEAIGASIDEVLPGARERVMGTPADTAAGRTRARMPYVNRAGTRLHLGLAGSILRDVDGAPSGHVVIFQDVTRVVRMERELTRSERMAAVGQLSAAIAHEIRNPLAAISGSIQMLRGGPEASDDGRRLMDIVLRETRRLDQLITDFLQYARPGPMRRERVRLAERVEEIAKLLESVRPAAIALEASVAPGLELDADPAQLHQLLWNLCLNAIQAMPGGGSLRIEAAPAPLERALPQDRPVRSRNGAAGEGSESVEITVRDTGAGIPPEAVDRIFDPFFTTKREGSGLGLATVHRIVEGHGGSLRVETAPGSGTAFRIRLPRSGDADPDRGSEGDGAGAGPGAEGRT